MAFGTKPSTFFFLVVTILSVIFISISPVRDVESKMMVPNGFPSWISELDQKLQASTAEELKTEADLIVAKDGTGNYRTVNEAVAAAPESSEKRFIIHVKKGIYNETVRIGSRKTNLTIVGDGSDATILTGNLNFIDGTKTFETATLGVDGNGFLAQDICIRNTAGPAKGQAVALRISADVSVIHRCRIEGYQDTLYAHNHRQFYRDCYITGTIDFICGHAAAVFQYCQIVARKPLRSQSNMLTAQSRSAEIENSGFTIQRCNITASSDLAPFKGSIKTFLGRPWNVFSRVVIMESFIEDVIDPEGWAPWNESDVETLSTLYYGEYKNNGPGADTSKRVKWKGFKVITNPEEASNFTVTNLLYGESWLNSTGVPYEKGL